MMTVMASQLAVDMTTQPPLPTGSHLFNNSSMLRSHRCELMQRSSSLNPKQLQQQLQVLTGVLDQQ